MSKALFTPPSARDLWREAGAFLHGHAELPSQASRIRGFGAGARWMHAAMRAAGWSLPPFGGERRHQRHGVLKYAVCLVGAVAVLALSPWIGLPRAIPVSVAIFYTLEAQAVFLFPETLRGSRSPWASSRAMVVVAGGTWRVMRTVIPIAVRMLLGGLRRRGLAATWAQGCVAVVLWHRRVAQERRTHLDSPRSLPRLELGPANPLLLRREHVRAGLRQGFRVLWISDLHWRGPGDASCLLAIFGIVRREGPDLVVLGGDFLEREAAHPLFARLVRRLAATGPCVVLPGNHDLRRIASLRATTLRHGGVWLPDEGTLDLVNSHGERLRVVGVPSRRGVSPATDTVKPDARILCVHDPADGDLGVHPETRGVAAVLAGHLHGGQCVWRESQGRLLPAAWIYRRARLREDHGGRAFIVSRGAGDTFPVRWNCPREVILCELR